MIYSIGDSHAIHAWIKIPGVETRGLGPMTMYSLGLSKAVVVKEIPTDAMVVFCWGEIDCRCHIYKYPPWPEMMDFLVKNYLETLEVNAKKHKNIWIYNIVPPPRRSGAIESEGFPFLGSDNDRLFFVKYMNKKLKESRFPMIDVYDKYADKDGFLKMEYSDAHVHIENEVFLVEKLKELGVLPC